MAKFKNVQSKNIEDDTPSASGKGDRLKTSDQAKREAGMNALRNYAGMNGMKSVAQTQNAKALGLEGAAADLQNTANKLVAARRTRMANIDHPPLEYLIKRKPR